MGVPLTAGAVEAPALGPRVALAALPFVALVVPAALVVSGPLQSNGWPARLLAFWCAAGVMLGWFARSGTRGRTLSPVEVGGWLLLAGLTASVAASGLRPLTEAEADGVLRAALVMFPLAIIALGLAERADRRFVDLLLTMTLAGAALSVLVALVQYAVGPFSFAEVIAPPGMTAREIGGFGTRGDYTRIKGTAAHPIEFGVLAGALAPVALHYARFSATHRLRLGFGAVTVLLLLATPLAVSRSGAVALVIAMVTYAVVLSTRQRLNLLVLGLIGAVLTRAALPGLLGAVTGLFLNISTDDSVSARTEDYAVADVLFSQAPLIGHGLGTFRPDEYFFVDNHYLLFLIEGGLVLVLATLAFVVVTVASARGAVRRATSPESASRGQAVLASFLAIAVSGAFFDLFSFGQATIVFFVLAGAAGALWRDARRAGSPIPTPAERLLGRV